MYRKNSRAVHYTRLFFALFLFFISLRAVQVQAVTLNASTVAGYFNGKVGSSFPNRQCLRFVEDRLKDLGVPKPYDCCASKSGSRFIVSSSSQNIPVGATVYFTYCGGGPCKTCGSRYYGHVGVYVGNGYFVHATGGKVQKTLLSSWSNKYRGYGYCGGYTLEGGVTPDVCRCSTAGAGEYVVSTKGAPLNIRSGHGTTFAQVGSIPNGTRVTVSKTDGSWGHVSYNGASGMVSMGYLKKYNPVPTLTWNVQDGAVYSGMAELTGTAADIGTNSIVRFYVDNVEIGSATGGTQITIHWNTWDYSNGSHVIRLRLTNDGGHDVSVSRTVTVRNTIHVEFISLESGDIYATANDIGKTYSLRVTVTPSDADNQNILWSSGDTSVATVSQSGTVTIRGIGATVITAASEDGNRKASLLVKVTENGVVYGDISGNGEVDSVDLARMRAIVEGTYSGTLTEEQKRQADLNGDGLIDNADLELLRKFIIQEILEFPVEKMLREIEISTPPSRTSYSVGDFISTSGMTVTAIYNSGKSKTVTGYRIVSGSTAQEGQTAVEISYTEDGVTRNAFYKITVTGGTPQDVSLGSATNLLGSTAVGGVKNYKVTWEPNGGTLSGSSSQTLSTISSLPKVTNEGYVLEGWYAEDGSKAAARLTLEHDTIYTAKWNPACSHPSSRVETFAATETELGEKVTYCSSCGEVLDVEYLPLAEKAETPTTEAPKETETTRTPETTPAAGTPETTPAAQQPAKQDDTSSAVKQAEAKDKKSLKNVTAKMTARKSDSDPTGSTFSPLRARAVKSTKNSVTLSWSKVKNARGYVVYGSACGNTYKLKKLKITSSNKVTINKIGSSLAKGKYYKFIVVAYQKKNGYNKVTATSKVVHACTTGGKYTNPKKVTVKASGAAVKKGRTYKIEAKVVKSNRTLGIKNHRKLTFVSANPKIASVSQTGKVTGKRSGTTNIYVYAQNGVYATVKITVK